MLNVLDMQLTSHTLAVSEVNGCLPNYLEDIIEDIKKFKHKTNLLAMMYHGLPCGEEGSKPKPKPKHSFTTTALPTKSH